MLLNTFKVATRALFVNKGRSFLTTLGIIIGVFSVVMLTGLGSGLQLIVVNSKAWASTVLSHWSGLDEEAV
jgi:putative ABC transport system permease protein